MCLEMEQLFREGVAEGKTEVMVLKSKEISRSMNQSGFSIHMISQILKVSISEVQDWISENRTPGK